MAVRVRCPNSHALSVGDDLLGKRIRCPKCGELFRAEEIADPPPKKKAVKKPKPVVDEDDEDDDEPRRPAKRRSRDDDDDEDFDDDESTLGKITSNLTAEERRKERQRDRRERLGKVNIGLLIHIIKLWAVVVLVLFIFLFRVFDVTVETEKLAAERDLSPEARDYFRLFTKICQIIVLCLTALTPVVGIASSVFCCLIPKKSEARPTIISALVFDVLPLIASVMIPLAAFDTLGLAKDSNERLLKMLVGASIFFSVSALFLFAVFLRQLAKYLQKSTLAAEALNLVSWLMIMTLAAPLVLGGMQYLGPMVQGSAGSVINVAVLFLLTLVWFGMFYYMFFQAMVRLIQTIRAHIGETT